MDWVWDGNLCVGLFYEHRFAMLKMNPTSFRNFINMSEHVGKDSWTQSQTDDLSSVPVRIKSRMKKKY